MIEDTIRRFISEELNANGTAAVLGDDYPLLDRGLLDSLGLFHLVGFLEAEYDIEIFDEDLIPRNFGSILTIAELVRARSRRTDLRTQADDVPRTTR